MGCEVDTGQRFIVSAALEVVMILDKASATTLNLPLMCRISVVNSAMNARCLVWRGDRSVSLLKEKVKG